MLLAPAAQQAYFASEPHPALIGDYRRSEGFDAGRTPGGTLTSITHTPLTGSNKESLLL